MKKILNALGLVSRSAIKLMPSARQLIFLFGLTLMLTFSVSEIHAQVDSTSIAVVPTFDKVYDRFGNTYNLSDMMFEPETDISPKTILYTGCNSGYFRLYLEPGSGVENFATNPIHQARLDIICQAFHDVANFITPANSNVPVNIWIRNINNVSSSPNSILGVGSSFYTLAANINGIVDGAIWQTINSGHDAYSSIVSPLITNSNSQSGGTAFYHGITAFNFNNIDWYIGSLTAGPTGGQYDLYSIALYEITHALGFTSLMANSGNSLYDSIGDYYARYDLRLQNSSNTPLLTQLSNTCGSMYDYTYNQPLSDITPNVSSCGIPNNTICSLAARFVSPGLNQAVYTPNCWDEGNSLSHFEDQCVMPAANDGYFLMSNIQLNASQAGFVLKRSYTPEERLALCALGYRVGTSFGTNGNLNNYRTYTGGSCGVSVAGTNDGVNANGTFSYVGAINTPITISGILNNDFTSNSTLSYECVQVVSGTTSSILPTSGTAAFTYTPTSEGIHILRYVPVSGTQKGNITYIVIAVTSGTCSPSTCNLVSNGGFENYTSCGIMSPSYQGLSCWTPFTGSPDVWTYGCNGTFNLSSSNFWLGGGIGTLNPVTSQAAMGAAPLESTQQQLPITLLPGNYILRFKARIVADAMAVPFFLNSPSTISFWGHPSTAPFAFNGGIVSNYGTLGFNILHTQIVANNQWTVFTVPITITANTGTLLISNSTPPVANQINYTVLDDIEIINYSIGNFTFPDVPVCQSPNLIDLNNFVDVPGGIFTGTGVVNNIFNPITAGVGSHLVTYTYTNTLGCVVQLFDNIVVTPLPTASITGNPVICNTTTLSASGGASYQWSNGLGNNSISNPISTAGIYSVTVTDIYGCTASANQNVVNTLIPITITGNNSICNAGSTSFIAFGGSGYQWSNGLGNNATSNPISAAGTYTVTVTTSNGCTASASTTVSLDPACLACQSSTVPVDLTITDPDLATFLSDPANAALYSSGMNGITIYFPNNFEINDNSSLTTPYYFSGSHLIFAPGVELKVSQGHMMKIADSQLESCDRLWKGINVENKAYLGADNMTISDAEFAVHVHDDARLDINNSLFDRNYVGIQYDDLTGGSFSLDMRNTTFDCTALLLPHNSTVSFPNWAYAGINLLGNGYLDLVSAPNITSNYNLFTNVANGIVANQCGYLGVQNCKFLNILPRSQFTDHYNGSGIVLLGTKDFNHIGLGTGTQLFSNCNFGVYNQQSNIFVNETRMDKMNIGVYSRLCNTGERIIVTNNYINTNRTSAVYLWQCDGASYVDIANNSVSVSRPNSSTTARHGILVNNFGTGASGFTRIRCNAVQVDNGWNGVNILNGQQYKVLENEVLLTDVNINQQGINVSNNNATAVLQNIVNSTFRPDTQNPIHYSPTAIKADNSTDGLYSDNLMSNTYTGLLMAGVSSGSEVKQNQFGDHYWGMNFTTTLVLNDQIDKGNTWIGAYGNADARHEGVPYAIFGQSLLQGRFKTLFSSTYTPSNIITTDPAASPSMWFDNSGVNPTIVPPASYCVEYAGGGEIVKRLSTHDIAIAKGELVTAEYPEEMEWWAKERLYNLLKDSIAWSLDTTLVNFKDSSELTTSKAFYDLRQDYKTWLSPDASLEAQYETVMASMQDQEALIKAKQEEIAVADSTQLAALYIELGILTSDYKDLKVLLEQVKLSLETLRTQTAEDIKGNNAAINTAALYESNQKIVNDIYYSTIAKGYGEFRPAQVALLANIANQCPFAGGPAVYQARSLYAAVVDTLYDDKAICQQVNIAYRPTSTTLTESASQAFKVFPNPAQTDLTVLADTALTEDTQLSLINTLGQVELSVWLNKGTTQKTISLAAIPNGLYICKIGQSVSYKLIVIKP